MPEVFIGEPGETGATPEANPLASVVTPVTSPRKVAASPEPLASPAGELKNSSTNPAVLGTDSSCHWMVVWPLPPS